MGSRMTPLPLLDYIATTRARRDDPPTSHAAAAQAEPVASVHERMIVAFLKQGYPRSFIVDQIADGIGLTSYQVSKRMRDLEVDGKIRLSGDTRPSKAGRQARCWVSA